MDSDEDVLEMTPEALREWIKEKVTEMLNPGTARSSRLQPLIERRERRLTAFHSLCESVAECEATMKEAYSVLGLEYRDTDSEAETHCTNSDHGSAPNIFDDDDADSSDISFFLPKLPLEKVCHALRPLSPLQQCSSVEDEVVEEWTLRLSGMRSQFSKTQFYSCSKCPYAFTSQFFLHKHMRTHNDIYYQMLKKGQITSAACQKLIDSVASQKQGHTDEPRSQPGEARTHQLTYTGKKTHFCKQCEKSYSCSSQLKRHLRVHNGEKPFHCKQCDKRYSDLSHLKRHLLVHTGEKPFSCNQCDKRFSCSSQLKRHLRVHTGEKPFHCNLCDKRFSGSSHLKRHLRVHTGEKPFPCNQCDKRYSGLSHLKQHLLVHTGEKPFHCNQCGKRYSGLSHLKQHLLVHTGEKPFHCNLCDKRFSGSSHLKRHLRVHTGEKPFPCNQCDKRFSRLSHLKRHLRVHTGEKPFPCNQGDKSKELQCVR